MTEQATSQRYGGPGGTLTSNIKGFKLLRGKELRDAAIAAGIIPKGVE